VRNIVLFRTIGSMALFKQIIGRGTRLDPDTDKWQFEVIDYCGASALFEDAEFDGPPLAEVEEEIDENGDVTHSVGEVHEPEPEFGEPATAPTPDDFEADDNAQKFFVDDEPVWVVAEGVFRLDASTNRLRLVQYREFLADAVRSMFSSAGELRSSWRTAPDRQAVVEALATRGIDLGDAVEHVGIPEADPLDLLVHLAWNEPLASRFDRVRRVRKERAAFFEQFGAEARAVLEELLDKYAEHGPSELSPAALQVPPISELGSPVELAQHFGGAEALRKAIAGLQDQLYAA
jgi:type I restriction enzyme R subunit